MSFKHEWEHKLTELSKKYVTEITLGHDFKVICTTWKSGLIAYTVGERVQDAVNKMHDVIFRNKKDDLD